MRFIIIFLLMVGLSTSVFADELQVVVNGKAIHLDDGDYNEENWGVGVNYDFEPEDKWVKFLHASYFKDSNYNTSKYAGGGIKRRYSLDGDRDGWRVDMGLIAFLMTRKDYNNNDPFPGVLPFVSIGNGPVSLNITYIPEVTPKHKDLLYLQLMVRIATFD